MRLTADTIRLAVPFIALAALLGAIFWLQPRAMSYTGLNLLFNLAVPIALATLAQMFIIAVNDLDLSMGAFVSFVACVTAQMFIIAVNDLDLSMGAFVSFVACVTATYLNDTPLLGIAILAASIAVYAALGVVIYLRQLPAIVVTLGMSFVWTGIAVMILPAPGGAAPEWIRAIMTVKPPLLPMAIVASALIALVAHLIVARSSLGVLIRGVGGNERSVARAGWSVVRARAAAYALGGFFAVLAGMALVGLTTSADANIALRYTCGCRPTGRSGRRGRS